MYRIYLATRWLLSRPINLLGMAGVLVAVWALIVVVSIFSGFLVEVREHVHGVTADLTVLNLPWGMPSADVEKIVRADPNVAACAPRVVWYGLLHAVEAKPTPTRRVELLDKPGADSALVSLVGIDPVREAAVTGLAGWIAAVTDPERAGNPELGAVLAPRGERAAILPSERRLRRNGLARDDAVLVTTARMHERSLADQPDLEEQAFAVAGGYATRHTAFNDLNCFVHIDAMRGLLGDTAGSSTELVVRCVDPADNATTASRLERALNGERAFPSILVRTWQEMNEQILSAVDHQRGLMKLVLIVIMVVAAFLMYATLSMMVTEKTHDIGILTAMGATRLGISQVFLTCGLAITGTGTVLGAIAGCLSAIHLDDFNRWLRATFDVDLFPTRIYNLDRVPYDLDPLWIGQVIAMAIGLGIVVSGLPAWWAARRDPVASLRNE